MAEKRDPKTHRDRVMSPSAPLEYIDAVDAFARTLFVRAKATPSPLFANVVTTVHKLHIALRHLRVEAADPDSLLRSSGASISIYARQLLPIVQDCEYALKQLETVLERSNAAGAREPDGLADRVASVLSRLACETTNVDVFLDTVQLHNPGNHAPEVLLAQTNDTSLERIKDKVDNIAKELFLSRDIGGGLIPDEDKMWQDFKVKLEMEGFSSHVLQQHKDILRAYIRELQSMSAANGGAPPTVRGMLEHDAMNIRSAPPVPPKMLLSPMDSKRPERYHSSQDDDESSFGIERNRRMSDHEPLLISSHLKASHDPFSSSSSSSDEDGRQKERSKPNYSLALISTKDLVAMDDVNFGIADMHLHPASTPLAGKDMRTNSNLGVSGISESWPPPNMATSQPLTTIPMSRSPSVDEPKPNSRRIARLAPDRYGKEIPMDALWTKVKRSLVSPQVLERAGVRYEARPDYVAILGRLSREQLAEYARQSAKCRAARSVKGYPSPRARLLNDQLPRNRADLKSRRDDSDDESVLWDESDTTDREDRHSKGEEKGYPYIVSPPNDSKTSSSTAIKPKPILKNKNENHVRFDPEPHEVEAKSPRSYDSAHGRDRRRENGPRRHREPRDSGRRGDDRHRWNDQRSSKYSDVGDRDRRRDRRGERRPKRMTWGETIGAVGIGGAAASLLGVLTEAAVGM